jgi:D-alanyl-D-alanine carboxypeptidase
MPTSQFPRYRWRMTKPSCRLAGVTAIASILCVGCTTGARPSLDAPASPSAAVARRDSALVARLQVALDSFRVGTGFPGATLGVALPDGRTLALATGMSDTARRIAMRPTDRMLSGSVGKTYVAAVALQLVEEGKLDLEAPISRYLGGERWFGRLPNARDITVRQLMNHTSGLVRYEFQPAVADALRRDPFATWTPERRLSFILDTQAPFAAGQGWEYSDTNYIVLGMIIERLTGREYYDEVRRRVLDPLGLRNTIPSDRRELPGVVNGYAGPKNELGGYDASLVDGRLAINPQFEWTGGGIASTADDLARWAKLLYEARAFGAPMLAQMVDGVPSKLGNARYGLGAIVRESADMGPVWGHSGFFPGYATEMAYLPDLRVSAAIQVNSTAPYPRGLGPFLLRVARIAGGSE